MTRRSTTSRTVNVGGRRVVWRVAGSGRPVVCVHGLSGSWRWWRPVLPALAESHEVHLLDLPRAWAGGAADWLASWLDANELADPVVVGHSLGGMIAAQVAARRRVTKLVLVGPAGIPTGRNIPREAIALAAALLTTRRRFLPLLATDAVRWGPLRLLSGALYATRTDLTVDLERIDATTLIVWGARDTLVPVCLGDAWRDGIRGARLVVIPSAAHVPMVETPSELSRVLSEFLADERGDAVGSGVVSSVRDTRNYGEAPVR